MAQSDPNPSTSFPGGDNASADLTMLRKAAEWLNKCSDTHPQCRPKNPSFRPRRLLNLGSPECQVKVEEFSSDSKSTVLPSIKYACLSHCWGGVSPSCMTTDQTIESNKAGVDWSKIPKTFQQAIVFTRNLGIQYMWIDSLCIIQNNEQDWLKEGAMMAEIYSNATITIAATRANNCNEGLYRDWKDGRDEPSRQHGFFCGWLKNPGWLCDETPLASRAWCFQELILSPRLLHFDIDKVLWKCQCGSTCPCESWESFPSASINFSGGHVRPAEGEETWCFMTKWAYIVCGYSSLHITNHSDKLAAPSGVAKVSGHLEQGHEYVAGLWKKSSGIPLALDWRTWGKRVQRRQTADEWAAPSWSWASAIPSPIDGCIINQWPSTVYPESTPAFSITDITLNTKLPPKDDPAGTGPLQREGTSMTVSGRAIEAKLVYDSYWSPDWGDPEMYRVSIGGVIESRFQPDYTIGDKSNEEAHLESNSTVHCFFLFTSRGPPTMNPGSIEKKMRANTFLVLSQKHHSHGVPIFERIGLLGFSPRDYEMIQGLLVENSTFCIV